MLANHPMQEATYHARALSDLVNERNNFAGASIEGSMMNLAENLTEEGHVFDHEPGYADYHHNI